MPNIKNTDVLRNQRYIDQLGGELAKAIEAITPDYQIGWEQKHH